MTTQVVKIIFECNGEVKNGVEHDLVDKAVKATREAIADELIELMNNSWFSRIEVIVNVRKLAEKLKED